MSEAGLVKPLEQKKLVSSWYNGYKSLLQLALKHSLREAKKKRYRIKVNYQESWPGEKKGPLRYDRPYIHVDCIIMSLRPWPIPNKCLTVYGDHFRRGCPRFMRPLVPVLRPGELF